MPLQVKWRVGGAFTINRAQVRCLDTSGENRCKSKAIKEQEVWVGGARQGPWTSDVEVDADADGPLEVRVVALVDQFFAAANRPEAGKGAPQTHFVNARTSDAWFASAGDATVQVRCPAVEACPPPLPSLPYKVDTSRPSIRTNWTRPLLPSLTSRDRLCNPARRGLWSFNT